MVEVQEPTDFSILLEWAGYAIDGLTEGHLGLGWDVALEALDRSRLDPERLAYLRALRPDAALGNGVTRLLPAEADEFFRVERVELDGAVTLDPSFAILVVLDGEGMLRSPAGTEFRLARGGHRPHPPTALVL